MSSECKRIEEGYKRVLNQVQQNLEAMVSTQEEQLAAKLKELELVYRKGRTNATYTEVQK